MECKAIAGPDGFGGVAQERAFAANRAGLDQGLDAGAGQAADDVGEEAVRARARCFRAGHDLDHVRQCEVGDAWVRQLEGLGCGG